MSSPDGGPAFPDMMMVLRLDDGETIILRRDNDGTSEVQLMTLLSDHAIRVLTWAKTHTVASATALIAEKQRREGGSDG